MAADRTRYIIQLFSRIDIESREREINVKCCRNIDLRKASNPIFSKKYFSQDIRLFKEESLLTVELLYNCPIVATFFHKKRLISLNSLKNSMIDALYRNKFQYI